MDSGGRLQNHLKAAPFRLCAKSLHIMSSSMPVGMFVDWASLRLRERDRRTSALKLSLCVYVKRNAASSMLLMSSFPQTLCFASFLQRSSSLVERDLLVVVVNRASNAALSWRVFWNQIRVLAAGSGTATVLAFRSPLVYF
ncbi:hypothetical protein TIFTF001_028427 [Ficus carica]|uniref:Uncharacterized protein n=1 Tax=Ficus carica TaxID=3494 RepID=A0AA88DPU3_FICCA|nr:hypothetical protein TIFTF001_028427 [Ficus carica]